MDEENKEWKKLEGYIGLRAMEEARLLDCMSEAEQEECERLAPIDTSWHFVDADEPEDVLDETAEFRDWFDRVSGSPQKTQKALTHSSMVLSERVKRICRDIIDRCRYALRDRTHVDTAAFCDVLGCLEREVWDMDQWLVANHMPKCYGFCSEKLERAHDILDAVMSRDERWQMEEARRNVPHVTFAEKHKDKRKHYAMPLFKSCIMVRGTQRKTASTAIQAQFLVGQGWRPEAAA